MQLIIIHNIHNHIKIIIIIKSIYTWHLKAKSLGTASTARSAAGKQFQTRGPVTANDLSLSLVLVLGTAHAKEIVHNDT